MQSQSSVQNPAQNPASVSVQQHMKGAAVIAAVFGVKREAVVQWYKKGAPIRLLGKKYQAQYGQLWDWILENPGR